MRGRAELFLEKPRLTFGRWLGAGLVIIGVHISGVAIGVMQWHAPLEPPAALPPAVMIDLQPVAVPPPPPQRIVTQPEPEIVEPDIDLPPLAELEDLPLLPDVQPVVEVKKKEKEKEKKKEPEKAAKNVAEKKKTKKKSPEPKPIEPKPVESKPVEINLPPRDFKTATDAPSPTTREVELSQAAALPTGPTPGELAAMAQAKANWNALLNAHLLKYKRYPRAAKRRNQTGTPLVQFRIDRNGIVQDVRLAQSSGVGPLDDEAVALFWRATPLPALPSGMPGSHFEAPIGIKFTLDD